VISGTGTETDSETETETETDSETETETDSDSEPDSETRTGPETGTEPGYSAWAQLSSAPSRTQSSTVWICPALSVPPLGIWVPKQMSTPRSLLMR